MAVRSPEGDCSFDQRRGMWSWASLGARRAPRFEIFSSLSSLATWSARACCSRLFLESNALSFRLLGSLSRDLIDLTLANVGLRRKMAGELGKNLGKKKVRKGRKSRRQHPKNEPPARRRYGSSVGCHDNIVQKSRCRLRAAQADSRYWGKI